MTDGILVRFWGVRGSVPVPGPMTQRYGGNTSCVELRCGPHIAIFDAGSGLRALGRSLSDSDRTIDADLFITHPHLDHVMGLPHFLPFYGTENRLRIRTPKLSGVSGEDDWIAPVINPPFFPVPLDRMGAHIERHAFAPCSAFALAGGISVRTIALPHPGGAVGLRLDYGGTSVVYLTDVELAAGNMTALSDFCSQAGLLICDAMYRDEELAAHRGWGHSSWQEAARLAEAARVSQLVLFHHAPGRTDAELDEIGWQGAKQFQNTRVASEGLTLRV